LSIGPKPSQPSPSLAPQRDPTLVFLAGGSAEFLELRCIDKLFAAKVQPKVMGMRHATTPQLGQSQNRRLPILDDENAFWTLF
jgi:hypothetical protein